MLVITDADVRELFSYDEYITALEEGYRLHGMGQASVLPRKHLWLPEGKKGSLKVIAAAIPALGVMGVQLYSGSYTPKGYPKRAVLLFDANNGTILSLIHTEYLCLQRTGATSALASKVLAREGAGVAGFIGSGRQARSQLLALNHVLDLREVRVFSPTKDHRESFAREMSTTLGLQVEPAESAFAAVNGADVVVTATKSKEPVIQAEWLKPGVHVNAIGAHYPNTRELGTNAIKTGKLIVDIRQQALEEYGELIIPVREGLFGEEIIHADLGEIICGTKQGRESDMDITIFKGGGSGIDYLSICGRVYKKALESGRGMALDI